VGDEVADRILMMAREAGPDGLTFEEIQERFSRHLSVRRRNVAIQRLIDESRVVVRQEETAGRYRSVVCLAT
jgi:hypothetical protein